MLYDDAIRLPGNQLTTAQNKLMSVLFFSLSAYNTLWKHSVIFISLHNNFSRLLKNVIIYNITMMLA